MKKKAGLSHSGVASFLAPGAFDRDLMRVKKSNHLFSSRLAQIETR
jgi:hypothetical protein